MSNSSWMPVPSALMIAWTSLLASTLSMRAFSTFRILPRIGRIAWMRGSRPCLAEPPAESPSTMKTSHSSGLVDWQSASLPGRPPLPRRPLRSRARSRALRAAILALAVAELDGDDRGQALPYVVAGDPVVPLLDQAPLLAPVVDQRGERRAEA